MVGGRGREGNAYTAMIFRARSAGKAASAANKRHARNIPCRPTRGRRLNQTRATPPQILHAV